MPRPRSGSRSPLPPRRPCRRPAPSAPPVSPRRHRTPPPGIRSRLPGMNARPATGRVRPTTRTGMPAHSRFESHSMAPRSPARGPHRVTTREVRGASAFGFDRAASFRVAPGATRVRRLHPAGFMRLPSSTIARRRPRGRRHRPSPLPPVAHSLAPARSGAGSRTGSCRRGDTRCR